jgi:glucose-6-phosphate 1-dehydrogenase
MSSRCDALVLFGATGDLARRKLFPALQELARDGRLPARIVGVASSDWSDDQLRARAREGITAHATFNRYADEPVVELFKVRCGPGTTRE